MGPYILSTPKSGLALSRKAPRRHFDGRPLAEQCRAIILFICSQHTRSSCLRWDSSGGQRVAALGSFGGAGKMLCELTGAVVSACPSYSLIFLRPLFLSSSFFLFGHCSRSPRILHIHDYTFPLVINSEPAQVGNWFRL